MEGRPLDGKNILITGGGRRIGKFLTFECARLGANIILHYMSSKSSAESISEEVRAYDVKVYPVQADFEDTQQVLELMDSALSHGPLYALVNNASIFEALDWKQTDITSWNRHLMVNLTVPFLLSQAFAKSMKPGETGRIINLLDWRVSRPSDDHLPYTISKSGLAALTKSLARSFAPSISVNGIALGAILPPTDGSKSSKVIKDVPMRRWGKLSEVGQIFTFLLTGPAYITGEVIHLDGGRHLV